MPLAHQCYLGDNALVLVHRTLCVGGLDKLFV